MNFFDKLTGKGGAGGSSSSDDKKKKTTPTTPAIKNPFANVGKAMQGNRTFHGQGNSLGGSKPGKVIHVELSQPGPLGMKIEKRPNSEGTAIVAMVMEGSQAAAAGLQRGDIVCFANTNGQDEIMYDLFLDMAASPQRPLVFDIRRIQTKSASTTTSNTNTTAARTSAEAYNRKQAVIAAAEAREKAARAREKPIKKTFVRNNNNAGADSTGVVDVNAAISNTPQSEEARRAVEAAKRGENQLAAQLGYNPYETNKSTAGQARNATVATKHGSLGGGHAVGGGGTDGTMLPTVAPPKDATSAANDDDNHLLNVPPVSDDFALAFEEIVTTNHDVASVVSSFGIMRKLIVNATTKTEDKFKRVRLNNPKIRAAITDMNGALDIMMSCGFTLATDETDNSGESILVYLPDMSPPDWLPRALHQMQKYEQSS